MQCSSGSGSLHLSETDTRLDALFEGQLGSQSIGLLISFAETVRTMVQPKPVRLDITRADSIEDTGLAGLLSVEQAAKERGVPFEIRAAGADAATKLAQAGLARVLYSGP
jgi:ABC-type tungstate transport system permease subunit